MLVPITATNNGGSDRLPVFKYDARAGRMHLMDRIQDHDGNWVSQTRDITMSNPQFAIDFGSVEVGWLLFQREGAPMMVTVPAGQPLPAEPPAVGTKKLDSGKEVPNRFSQGFRFKVAGSALKHADGRQVREFAANARVVIEGINELHAAFEAAPEAVAGKIPVIRMKEAAPTKTGQSTNYKPVFEITAWVDRDDKVFGERTVPAPGAVKPVPAPAAPAYTPPPPPAAPVAAPAMAGGADDLPF